MFLDRRTTRGLLLVTVLAAAAACADRTSVSSPLGPSEATVVTAGPQSSSKVKVKTFQLSSNSLGIEGAAVSGNVSVANSGLPIDGVTIRGQITQGAATREAMSMGVNCAGTPGTLSGGACNMTFGVKLRRRDRHAGSRSRRSRTGCGANRQRSRDGPREQDTQHHARNTARDLELDAHFVDARH